MNQDSLAPSGSLAEAFLGARTFFDEEFVEQAYLRVLGRDADPAGRELHLTALRESRLSRQEVLMALVMSDEGRQRWGEAARAVEGQFDERLAWRRREEHGRWGKLVRALRMARRAHDYMQATRRKIGDLYARSVANQRQADVLTAELATLSVRHETAITELRAEVEVHKRELFALQHALLRASQAPAATPRTTATSGAGDTVVGQPELAIASGALDNFYLDFENRFRGDKDLIAARQAAYFPIIERLCPHPGPLRALDIGCGRGEWLSLLRERGHQPAGVDLNALMIQHCRESGLTAAVADGAAYLAKLPDHSLDLITAFHVIEHIPFAALLGLMDEARRVLVPGGLVIVETPNPENVVVGACTFYMDPSHLRPLPPQLVEFVAHQRGFSLTEVVYLNPDSGPDHSSEQAHVLSRFNMAQDYAVVAQK